MKNCGPAAFFVVFAQNSHGPQPVGTGRTPAEALADALTRPGGVQGPAELTDESTYNRARAHLALWDARCRWAALVGDDLVQMPPGYSHA